MNTLKDVSAWVGGAWAILNVVWVIKNRALTPIPAESAISIRAVLIKARTITNDSINEGGSLGHPWYLDRKTPVTFTEMSDELDAAIALIGRGRQLRSELKAIRSSLNQMYAYAAENIYAYFPDSKSPHDEERERTNRERAPIQLEAARRGLAAVTRALQILDRRTRKF